MRFALTVACAAVLALSGCSMLAVNKPDRRPGQVARCPSSFPVVADVAVGAVLLLGGLALSQVDSETSEVETTDISNAAPVLLLPGVIAGISAIHGGTTLARCERANRAAMAPALAVPAAQPAAEAEAEPEAAYETEAIMPINLP